MALDVVAIQEIAEMLGVSKQRVSRIIQTHPDFPAPDAELSIGRVWRRHAVEAWIASHPRRTGRPSKIGRKPIEGNRPPTGGAGGSRGGRKPRPT